MVLRHEPLSDITVEIFEIGAGCLGRAARRCVLVDKRDRRLGLDGDGRHHDLELAWAELIQRQEGLVLPRQQNVADAAPHERRGRGPRPRVEHRDIAIELADEVLDLGLVAIETILGPGPGGEQIPARAARRLRIGRQHLYVRPDGVAPILDILGVALAHQKDDRGRVRGAVVGQAPAPVACNLARVLHDRVDVRLQRERHDVGLEPVDHGARLRTGAAMRLLDRYI